MMMATTLAGPRAKASRHRQGDRANCQTARVVRLLLLGWMWLPGVSHAVKHELIALIDLDGDQNNGKLPKSLEPV